MRILLLKTWLSNIGNGFIDKGARALIEKAFPEAEIIEASGFPHIIRTGGFNIWNTLFLKTKIFRLDTSHYQEERRILSIGDLVDVDFAILPGCVLYQYVLSKYFPALMHLRKRGIPIILLGAGGYDYTKQTRNLVIECLIKLKIDALLTRDSIAYKYYSGFVEYSYDGIDCAFFVNDWYTPKFSANQKYVVTVFDSILEPPINTEFEIIRATHAFLSPKRLFNELLIPAKSSIRNKITFDSLEDYLFLYKNTFVTYSDRIHACIPTLVYGNKAQFFNTTPRETLFEKVIEGNIKKTPISIEQNKLQELKKKQIEAFRRIISNQKCLK